MLRLWKWYQNCLATHPVKTQAISSGFIWGFGDVAAQAVTQSTAKSRHLQTHDEDKQLRINWRRVATTSLFGLGYVGPVGHFWETPLGSNGSNHFCLKRNKKEKEGR